MLQNNLQFEEISIRQDSISFIHRNVVNCCIAYELDAWSGALNTDFTLGSCLFGAVKFTKNADPTYSTYGIRFDACLQFWWSNGEDGKLFLLELIIGLSCLPIIEKKMS